MYIYIYIYLFLSPQTVLALASALKINSAAEQHQLVWSPSSDCTEGFWQFALRGWVECMQPPQVVHTCQLLLLFAVLVLLVVLVEGHTHLV